MTDDVYCFPLITIAEGLEQFKSEAHNIILACINNDQPLPPIQHALVSFQAKMMLHMLLTWLLYRMKRIYQRLNMLQHQ